MLDQPLLSQSADAAVADAAAGRHALFTPPYTPRPDRILEVGMAFWSSKTLLSAVELGLFSLLANGPCTGAAIATRIPPAAKLAMASGDDE